MTSGAGFSEPSVSTPLPFLNALAFNSGGWTRPSEPQAHNELTVCGLRPAPSAPFALLSLVLSSLVSSPSQTPHAEPLCPRCPPIFDFVTGLKDGDVCFVFVVYGLWRSSSGAIHPSLVVNLLIRL